MNDYQRIGHRIAIVRRARGIKQVELGAAIGVSDQTVSNWEVGIWTPRADYLLKLCKTLNCSADYLLGITDEPFGEAAIPAQPHGTEGVPADGEATA